MANSIDVANEFIKISREARRNKQGRLLSQMDLMKMMFFAHGVSLAKTGKPLITDDTFKAWDLGPVLPNLYHNHTKKYQGADIENILDIYNQALISDNERNIINNVYESLQQYTATQLSQFSHREGRAWERNYVYKANAPIPNEEIRKDFIEEGLIKTNQDNNNIIIELDRY